MNRNNISPIIQPSFFDVDNLLKVNFIERTGELSSAEIPSNSENTDSSSEQKYKTYGFTYRELLTLDSSEADENYMKKFEEKKNEMKKLPITEKPKKTFNLIEF